jgi:hypothetical protein
MAKKKELKWALHKILFLPDGKGNRVAGVVFAGVD